MEVFMTVVATFTLIGFIALCIRIITGMNTENKRGRQDTELRGGYYADDDGLINLHRLEEDGYYNEGYLSIGRGVYRRHYQKDEYEKIIEAQNSVICADKSIGDKQHEIRLIKRDIKNLRGCQITEARRQVQKLIRDINKDVPEVEKMYNKYKNLLHKHPSEYRSSIDKYGEP